jgi:hypothetical protein
MFARFVTVVALWFGALGVAGAADMQLFYLPDCCIRDMNDPKAATYEAAVEALRREGFTVSFEANTRDGELATQRQVAALADRILALLAAGAFAENITVVGHARGATTALLASALVENRRVNYVLLGGCPAAATPDIDYAKVMGRFLVLTDVQEHELVSCRGLLPEHLFYKESSVTSPEGGSVFLRTDEESLRLWRDPVVSFVTAKGARRGR